MDGGGKVTIPETGQLNISGASNKSLRDCTINNSGTTTWSGTGNINSGLGAVFNNLAGGIFDVKNDRSFSNTLGGAAPVFSNTGTVRKTAGAGTTTMNVSLQNDGMVDVDTGTLSITRGGASTGTFEVASAATLKFAANYTANQGTDIIGAGSTQLTAGTFSIGATAVGADALTALNLQLAGATLGGAGDLTIDAGGVFTWSGGTMDGGGKVTIPETGQLNISGASNKSLRDRTINNSGTTTWSGTGNINSGLGAVFNNLAGGIFDVKNDRSFSNTGTVQKTAGAATTTMNVSLQNDGTVDVDTGTLSITRGGASTGTFEVASAATLKFAANYTANQGTDIIGAGSTQLTAGTFSIGARAIGTDALTALNLQLAGGTLGGAGDLTIDAGGVFTWSGGTIDGGGKVTIPETGQLNISGASNKSLRDRTINNSGTTTWSGTGNINSGLGAVFNNLAGGIFDVKNDRSFSDNLGGAAPVFNNTGTVRKTAGAGTTTISVTFNNTGIIDIQTGIVNTTNCTGCPP